MLLRATCTLRYDFAQPTPVIFLLKPHPQADQQIIQQDFLVTPPLQSDEFADSLGNINSRLLLAPGHCTVETTTVFESPAQLDVHPDAKAWPVMQLPPETLPYVMPSRYCQADLMISEAQQLTAHCQTGYQQAAVICDHIHRHWTYEYGSSDSLTTALDTWHSKKGVCRDFAHLGMTLCRALDLPARMVAGFLYELDPMDLHAWYEVYIGGQWYTFDPTQPAPRGHRLILAYGRDATDVAFATFFAPFECTDMQVSVEPVALDQENESFASTVCTDVQTR